MYKISLTIVLFLGALTLNSKAQTKSATIKAFVEGIINLEQINLNEASPISTINKVAPQLADKTITLTKENIISVVDEAEYYKHCIITVGNHTIAKITDHLDFIQSGSWESILPKGEGYVQRGALTYKNDYLNNIIGRPDSQLRKVYLFAPKLQQ